MRALIGCARKPLQDGCKICAGAANDASASLQRARDSRLRRLCALCTSKQSRIVVVATLACKIAITACTRGQRREIRHRADYYRDLLTR